MQYSLESAYASWSKYSGVRPSFYPFRADRRALGIFGMVTSEVTVCGNVGFSHSSGMKGEEEGRQLQEEE